MLVTLSKDQSLVKLSLRVVGMRRIRVVLARLIRAGLFFLGRVIVAQRPVQVPERVAAAARWPVISCAEVPSELPLNDQYDP